MNADFNCLGQTLSQLEDILYSQRNVVERTRDFNYFSTLNAQMAEELFYTDHSIMTLMEEQRALERQILNREEEILSELQKCKEKVEIEQMDMRRKEAEERNSSWD